MADNRIYEIATKLRRMDRFNVLMEPFNENNAIEIINKLNYPQLYNESLKVVDEMCWK